MRTETPNTTPARRLLAPALAALATVSVLTVVPLVAGVAVADAEAPGGPGPLLVSVQGTPSAVAVDSTHHLAWVAQLAIGKVAVVDTTTGYVVGEVDVGTEPDGVAVDPSTDTVYVANGGSGTVSVINGSTRAVTATVTVGSSPAGIAVDSGSDAVFVADSGSDSVSVINGSTNAVVATTSVGATPSGVAVNPVTAQVYVTNGGGSVSFLAAGAPYAVARTVTLGGDPSGVAVDPATNMLYVADDEAAGSLDIVSGTTGTTSDPVAVGASPEGVGFDAATGDLLVANSGSGTVSVLNGAGPSVVETLSVASAAAIAVDSSDDVAYVADGASDQVTGLQLGSTRESTVTFPGGATAMAVDSSDGDVFAIDRSASSVELLSGTGLATETPISDGGTDPAAVAVDPDTNLAYVANYGTGDVSVLNESGGVVGSPIPVGPHPDAVAVDAATDTIYVAEYNKGELSVIDGADPGAAPSTVPAGDEPNGIAVDPTTGAVFVARHDGVVEMSGSPLAKTASVTLPGTPTGIAFDATDQVVDVVLAADAGITQINPVTMTAAPDPVTTVTSPSAVVAANVSGLVWVASKTGGLWGLGQASGQLAASVALAKPTALAVDQSNGTVAVASPGKSKDTELTLLGGPVAPAPVGGLVATPANLAVTLAWTASSGAATGGSAVTGYAAAMFQQGSSVATSETTVGPGTTAVSFSGLTNGTPLYFEVSAMSGAGPGSPATSPVVVPATVPDAPTGVKATAGDASASVSWTAPSADGGDPLSSYVVTPLVGRSPQTSLASTVTGADGNPPPTATTVKGLTNGTTYSFEVAAVSLAGSSSQSAPSGTVMPATVPGQPSDVTATPGTGAATVHWTIPSDGGLPISSFTVTPYVGTVAQTKLAVSTEGTADSATVTGLTNGTAYTFTVRATNKLGNSQASAPSAAVVPAALPGVPSKVTARPGHASAEVSWTAPSSDGGITVTSYVVTPVVGAKLQSSLAVIVTGSDGAPPATHVEVSGLTDGTAYTFVVRARTSRGSSAESDPSSAVVPGNDPAAPTVVTALPGTASATVRWTAPSDGGSPITSYLVTPFFGRTAEPGLAVTVRAVKGKLATSAVVPGLPDGTPWRFDVAARNQIGAGPASRKTTTVWPAGPPSAPRGVTASIVSAGATTASVTWSASVSTGGIRIRHYVVTPIVDGKPDTALAKVTKALSALFHGLTYGTSYSFTVVAENARLSSAAAWSNPVVPLAGYWVVTATGQVIGVGAPSLGSVTLAKGDTVAAIASVPSGRGYVVVTSHGTVSCFGVQCHGSLHDPASPVVSILLDPGVGYLLVESNGSVYAFGRAHSYGSLRKGESPAPIVGAAMEPDEEGYLMVSSTGHVFAFGQAHSYGSLNKGDGSSPAKGIAIADSGKGYYITQATGAVRAFGAARSYGSFTSLGYRIDPAGLAVFADSNGYLEAGKDGVLFSLGPGSAAYAPVTTKLTSIVGIALQG